ncbi:MAG: phage portal protein [Candidatus Omnitrophica bacterium]|nr:phage portal protein [Candidatus Omnitrophota bacterium]
MIAQDETKTGILEKAGRTLDDMIGVFSPQRAFKRQAFRKAREIAASSYRGAERSRLRSDWFPKGYSADQDLFYDHALLRERSRDLNRNDAHASGITTTVTTNVVGIGIKPQSRIDKDALGIGEEEAVAFQKAAERVWEKWVPFADASERMDFYEIEALMARQELENGESIILPLMLSSGDRRHYSLALDVIESDRLVTPQGYSQDKRVRFGVRIGELGEPVEYYLRINHPGDISFRKSEDSFAYKTYSAVNKLGRRNVLHLYEIKRPGQTRGVPFFAPVLTYFKDKADYMEAELVAARIAACFALFVKKQDALAAATIRTSPNDASQRIESIEPGMFEYLNPGEEIQSFNPSRPNAQYDAFISSILRAICSALNLSYEIVSKDFSQTNYSSARASLLQAYKYFRLRQDWLARKFCQPIWEMLLEEAFLRNELPARDFYKNKYEWMRARWIAPGWQWVDPYKEAEAAKLTMDMGLSSLADEAAAQGKDFEEILGQKVREAVKIKELEEKYKIKLIKDGKNDKAEPKDEEEKNGQKN